MAIPPFHSEELADFYLASTGVLGVELTGPVIWPGLSDHIQQFWREGNLPFHADRLHRIVEHLCGRNYVWFVAAIGQINAGLEFRLHRL